MRRLSFAHVVLWSTIAVVPYSLAVPSARAAEAEQRYYDREHRDYHVWNAAEDRAYRGYLAARRRSYIEYRRLKQAEQRAYWHWRHKRIERERRERR